MTQAASTIVVLGCGGTISSTADASVAEGYRAGAIGVDALLPEAPPAQTRLESEQVAQLNSKDMDAPTWARLARRVAHHLGRTEVAGVVVTHGTDTLEETAWLLARVLDPGKPVVLTGAMRPADAADADGPRNVADAIGVVAALAPFEEAGVAVVFAGETLAARDVRKLHGRRLSPFSPGEAGSLGSIVAGVYRARRLWPREPALLAAAALPAEAAGWPWVEIVASGALADGRGVDALVAAGVRGLVVSGTGNGTVHDALAVALARATAAGVTIVRSTRCPFGGVVDAVPEAAQWPADAVLTPAKARVELMLTLLARAVAKR